MTNPESLGSNSYQTLIGMMSFNNQTDIMSRRSDPAFKDTAPQYKCSREYNADLTNNISQCCWDEHPSVLFACEGTQSLTE
ncbi:hypothetical protein THIOM_001123 [Candidatus Thiomargarita nelsonii]|uniref:Uncharacterized protein n=1 Tax=Candidatus Thiomargarita nelsonii TaxID=1003181 RepID=A0A176S4W6_9GAMM|nr:hypothetical protein THIOM_001123 [Candidatus Thiomargarita nelsonii]